MKMRIYLSHFTQLFVYQITTITVCLEFTYQKSKIGECI